MTHLSVAGSRLEVPEALVRLSVGIEGAADLIDGPAPGARRR
jgi:cystathionine gamma-synthase